MNFDVATKDNKDLSKDIWKQREMLGIIHKLQAFQNLSNKNAFLVMYVNYHEYQKFYYIRLFEG